MSSIDFAWAGFLEWYEPRELVDSKVQLAASQKCVMPCNAIAPEKWAESQAQFWPLCLSLELIPEPTIVRLKKRFINESMHFFLVLANKNESYSKLLKFFQTGYLAIAHFKLINSNEERAMIVWYRNPVGGGDFILAEMPKNQALFLNVIRMIDFQTQVIAHKMRAQSVPAQVAPQQSQPQQPQPQHRQPQQQGPSQNSTPMISNNQNNISIQKPPRKRKATSSRSRKMQASNSEQQAQPCSSTLLLKRIQEDNRRMKQRIEESKATLGVYSKENSCMKVMNQKLLNSNEELLRKIQVLKQQNE